MRLQVLESEDILGQGTMSKVVAEQPADRGHSGQALRVPSGTWGRGQAPKAAERSWARCPGQLGAVEGFCTEQEPP